MAFSYLGRVGKLDALKKLMSVFFNGSSYQFVKIVWETRLRERSGSWREIIKKKRKKKKKSAGGPSFILFCF